MMNQLMMSEQSHRATRLALPIPPRPARKAWGRWQVPGSPCCGELCTVLSVCLPIYMPGMVPAFASLHRHVPIIGTEARWAGGGRGMVVGSLGLHMQLGVCQNLPTCLPLPPVAQLPVCTQSACTYSRHASNCAAGVSTWHTVLAGTGVRRCDVPTV